MRTDRFLRNSEYHFTKQDVNGNIVGLTLYIQYDRRKYSIQQVHEESVFFGKNSSIERDIMYADLCREIMLFVQSELMLNSVTTDAVSDTTDGDSSTKAD